MPGIQRLMEIRLLDDEALCPEFSQLCESLSEEDDPSLLPDLLGVFTDRTQHHEIMADLQGLVETFPAKAYADALSNALPGMLADARGWAKQLLRTMLQTPAYPPFLKAARARGCAADRKKTAALFEEVAKETPQVQDVALELAKL